MQIFIIVRLEKHLDAVEGKDGRGAINASHHDMMDPEYRIIQSLRDRLTTNRSNTWKSEYLLSFFVKRVIVLYQKHAGLFGSILSQVLRFVYWL